MVRNPVVQSPERLHECAREDTHVDGARSYPR